MTTYDIFITAQNCEGMKRACNWETAHGHNLDANILFTTFQK